MKIGVVSDTHLRIPNEVLDFILEEVFRDASMILHAGDIIGRKVLDRLEEREVIAVCGNMDDFEVAEALPQTRIISAAGKSIGLIHGWGAKDGLENRIIEKFADEKLDLIVYGHSHVPLWTRLSNVYLFNPGSASQNRYSDQATVGLIDITNDTISAKILTLQKSAGKRFATIS
ncbi:MAG: metallophosphoesterase family protein [Desulfomonile tiedjei]|uniref:Phosphoesterase n=1 Tax=Desulfomonile tiedjei TaxID=2358 RepID=A0A9D6V6H8_9BACT|nr:metallophosphoesterase family protein [Desulfomonile tiedjei]